MKVAVSALKISKADIDVTLVVLTNCHLLSAAAAGCSESYIDEHYVIARLQAAGLSDEERQVMETILKLMRFLVCITGFLLEERFIGPVEAGFPGC